jgi:hypothetical protein
VLAVDIGIYVEKKLHSSRTCHGMPWMQHRFHEKFQPLLGVLEMGDPKINQVTDHFGKTSMVLGCFGVVFISRNDRIDEISLTVCWHNRTEHYCSM